MIGAADQKACLVLKQGPTRWQRKSEQRRGAEGEVDAMDCAKAIDIMLTNPGKINDYDGLGLVKNPTKPLIAIPTTAGTASGSDRIHNHYRHRRNEKDGHWRALCGGVGRPAGSGLT
jgi:hypothetical protein